MDGLESCRMWRRGEGWKEELWDGGERKGEKKDEGQMGVEKKVGGERRGEGLRGENKRRQESWRREEGLRGEKRRGEGWRREEGLRD